MGDVKLYNIWKKNRKFPLRSLRTVLGCMSLFLACPREEAVALSVGSSSMLLPSDPSGDVSLSQPPEERAVQETLPMSHDPAWDMFAKCKVSLDQDNYTYSIRFTPEVKTKAGRRMKVSGFMLPLDVGEEFTHFLLSKRTPTCPFCPPGEPNEIVEIVSTKKLKWAPELMTVSGTLELTNDPEKGLFFRMSDATIVP